MRVWLASFELSQNWLAYLPLGGFLALLMGWRIEEIGELSTVEGWLGFVPPLFGIENPVIRVGAILIALWLPLSFILTIKTRLEIRSQNQVRPKK